MELLPYLIAGLVTGSIYGLTATGLVLTYKTSAVFNFGHGATAAIAAFLFYALHVTHGMSWPLAAVICVVVLGPVLGLGFELLARSLTDAPLVSRVTATVGVLITVQALIGVIYGTSHGTLRQVDQFLPTHAFHIGDTIVRGYQLIIIAITLVAAASLWLFFRVTRTGVAMRAVVDNADLLDLAGTDPVRVRRLAWMIGTSFACASGVLLSPLLAQLDPINLTFMVVTAFGAAAVGGFTNIPMTYVGGLAIGIGQALLTKYFNAGFWSGLAPALPFIVLFVVLLVLPKRRLVERQSTARLTTGRRMPWPVQAVLGAVALIVLVLVPSMFPDNVNDWSNGLAYLLVFLSLGLLVRTSGQVSLAHVSFMAIGAAAMAHLTVDHGVNWWLALVISGLIALPIGAILAIPAIRLSGLYLALATFGFGVLLQFMFYAEDYMFGSFGLGLTLPRPGGFEEDTNWYYLMVTLAVITAAGMLAVTRSRLGRLLRSMTDSPTGLSTAGAAINVTRVLVFCLSAFIASAAGALQGATVTFVSGDSYQPILSLILFVTVVVSVGRDPWYAAIAAFVVVVLPTLPLVFTQGSNTSSYITIIIGLLALFIGYRPAFVALAARLPVPAYASRRRRAARPAPAAPTAAAPPRPAVRSGSLEVSGLRVQFGGLVAVDGVSIEAPTGRITGLIGPNGAGKTTTFNACSGLNRPTAGTVRLDGSDAGRLGPSARARKGLGRTFQQMELFDSMSVRENIALGAEASRAGLNPLSHLAGSPSARREIDAITAESIELCGLQDIADRTVGALSTGQRRLVEIARCLAGPFHLLLLDEPSSGLDRVETERFAEVLTRVVADRGVGILIVEHDMSLVTGICDYVYVLDFGKPVFEGTAAEVMAAPIVKAAYLGGDGLEAELDVIQAAAPSSSPAAEEVAR